MIPKLENADWREQILAKRKKTYMPEESLRAPIEVVEEQIKEVGFGLQIKKRIKIEHHTEDKQDATNIDTTDNASATTMEMTEDIVMEEKTETLDEIAARKIIEGMSNLFTSRSGPCLHAR